MINNYPIVMQSPLFKGVGMDDLNNVFSSIHYRIKKYDADQIIAFEGDEVKCLYILLKGSVKGEMMDPSGKTIKIEDILPPKPLAIAFVFGSANKFPVNIVSNEPSELLVIEKADALKLFSNNEQILQNFLNVISSRSQFLTQKIKMLSFQTIKGKLANFFLQETKGEAIDFVLNKSQNALAELFGVARPSIGRAFKEMNDDGFIHIKGKSVRIIDIKGLRSYLST
ncbi:Crp/Fnr family transcriptional regulator [Saccharicrinis aurantiacus]|uniref:Crp/Fnr family transcriptional regulator n=1 Tax=Saccharicrinis aurantiacus TaxID=1849719 RepID=UPI0009FA51A3|nr:Crp/Fnr family transcriptional regulator [Saccharicrinis aurantiacus]